MEEEIVNSNVGNSHLFCRSNNGTADELYVDGSGPVVSYDYAGNNLLFTPSNWGSNNFGRIVPNDATLGPFTLHFSNNVPNPIDGFLNFIKSKCECRYSLSRIEKILRKKHSERTEKEKKIIKRIMQSSDKEERPKITMIRQESIDESNYQILGIINRAYEINCLPEAQLVDWRRRML
jgi:hypothetical protein